MYFVTVTTKTVNHPKPYKNHPKPSKTTQNFLKPTTNYSELSVICLKPPENSNKQPLNAFG